MEAKFDDHVFLLFFLLSLLLISKILWYIHTHRSQTCSISRIFQFQEIKRQDQTNLPFTLTG